MSGCGNRYGPSSTTKTGRPSLTSGRERSQLLGEKECHGTSYDNHVYTCTCIMTVYSVCTYTFTP